MSKSVPAEVIFAQQQTLKEKINGLHLARRYVRLARYLAKKCPSSEVQAACSEITNKFRTNLTEIVSDMNKNEVLNFIQDLAQLARV